MKNTVRSFREAKGQSKLSLLTAYDYSVARLVDQAGINGILVGDSLGMVMLGYPDTLPVTMEDMLHHCKAVSRAVKDALIICDLPFMSYQVDVADAVRNAGRCLSEGGAQAVKLEGGMEFAAEVEAITRASIPVMGHIGLQPQSVKALGEYKVQGKTEAAARKLVADARALENAGAFSIVLECVPAQLAREITRSISIPVIGIGAGPDCDGQILVWQDMAGLTDRKPAKFVKKFADVGQVLSRCFTEYDKAVKELTFPGPDHSYNMDEKELRFLADEKD